jgi:hypothetical protein
LFPFTLGCQTIGLTKMRPESRGDTTTPEGILDCFLTEADVPDWEPFANLSPGKRINRGFAAMCILGD